MAERLKNTMVHAEDIDTLIKFLLKECDPEQSPEERALEVRRKLRSLFMLFGTSCGDSVCVDVQEAIDRIESPTFSYEDLGEVEALIKRATEVIKQSDIFLDAHSIAGGLHEPEIFHSSRFQETLAKYPEKTRKRLRELGMNAFMQSSTVPHNDVEGLLSENA